ncbi:TrmB family transcriptional regulator [Halomarina litorea]|uniref:TrmB family transcriptional regulator n=1 Tax=Halomarina litorea TaxID=2961595 RepID=UPI0020C4BAC4|nr:helix-turn-helix domain-containing protein [Halomarina sp. BCD28]
MPTNEHRTRAVDSLESLGLREYEAKCFVALAQLSEGTAKEISKVAGVPRSRVYDSLEKLRDRGLVDVRESNPRRYRGVPVDTAIQTLKNEFDDHLDTASDNLSKIQVSPQQGDNEFWTISGKENVSERGSDLVESAQHEVFVMLSENDAVTDLSLGWIRQALDQGVTTFVDAVSEAQREDVEARTPGAQVFVSGRGSDDEVSVGRTLLVDGQSVLLSTVGEPLPTVQEETAVVSEGSVGSRIASLVEEVSRSRRDSGPSVEQPTPQFETADAAEGGDD